MWITLSISTEPQRGDSRFAALMRGQARIPAGRRKPILSRCIDCYGIVSSSEAMKALWRDNRSLPFRKLTSLARQGGFALFSGPAQYLQDRPASFLWLAGCHHGFQQLARLLLQAIILAPATLHPEPLLLLITTRNFVQVARNNLPKLIFTHLLPKNAGHR